MSPFRLPNPHALKTSCSSSSLAFSILTHLKLLHYASCWSLPFPFLFWLPPVSISVSLYLLLPHNYRFLKSSIFNLVFLINITEPPLMNIWWIFNIKKIRFCKKWVAVIWLYLGKRTKPACSSGLNCTPVLPTSCHCHFNLCWLFEGRSMSLISIPGTKHTQPQSRRDRRMEVWESWTREKKWLVWNLYRILFP